MCSRGKDFQMNPSKVRNLAIMLLAMEDIAYYDETIADALDWAIDIFESETHSGDCTRDSWTCYRCIVEEYERKAEMRLEEIEKL